jgi:5'-3' exonuclease
VLICTPDKDLSQCVRGTRVVQLDRRKNIIRDEAGVIAKFGVEPASIPDYLALVGDAADGYPGLAGWGAKSASKVLARYRHIESIPESWRDWGVDVVNPFALSETLRRDFERALLFRDLATLRSRHSSFSVCRRATLGRGDRRLPAARCTTRCISYQEESCSNPT